MERIYEDRHTLPGLRWFWSITMYVSPKLGITTSGRAPSLDEAKSQFLSNWQRCRADSTPAAKRPTRIRRVLASAYPAGGLHRAVPSHNRSSTGCSTQTP